MPTFTLNDDEHAVLARLLKETIASDRFPLSPRIKSLRTILAKLEPPAPANPEPYPPTKPPGTPSLLLAKKRRR